MKVSNLWSASPVAAKLLAGLSLCCLPTANSHAQIVGGTTTATSFRGEAAAVSGTALNSALSIANTGALAEAGGAQEASALVEQNLSVGVAAEASHAATVGQGNGTASEASAGAFSFTSCADSPQGEISITADFVMSRAQASWSVNGPSVSGQSEVTGLVVNGQNISVSGQSALVGLVINGQNFNVSGLANQTILLPNGSFVIINEQSVAQSATSADITVHALHVIAPCASADLVVGSSSAGATFGSQTSQPAPCGDFVTGGGWITGTPSEAKANFGAAGGSKDGALWGHLNYIDHGNGIHVQAIAVTGYAVDPTDASCQIIDYNVTIDGQPGTARVRLCDKGEPGRNDRFEIQLSSGYSAGGDLGGSQPGGGNIQLHQCR